MQDLKFLVGFSGTEAVKRTDDGFYILDKNWMNTRLVFPDSALHGNKGTRFRLTLSSLKKTKMCSHFFCSSVSATCVK